MASLTKYAGTVTQTTGGNYCSFSNLNNIKVNQDYVWATSNGRIKGKSSSPNRPSTVSCTNFNFNLPTGAEVTRVIVTYRHRKDKYNGNVCNIPAPTISLLGVTGFSAKGSAPKTAAMETHTQTWTTNKISRSQVNSSSFGCQINYPANTNSYEGTLSISYVRVTVEYKVPSYTVSVKKASGGYNEEEYAVECSISNKNLTSYNPTLTLSAPAGFSYKRAEGTGVATRVNNRTVTWNPKLTNNVGTSTIRLVFDVDVTYPPGSSTYTGTFTLSENLNSTTANHTATITNRPTYEEETAPDEGQISGDEQTQVLDGIQFVSKGEWVRLDFQLTDEEITQIYETGTSDTHTLYLQCFPNPDFDEESFEDADKLKWYTESITYPLVDKWYYSRDKIDEHGNIVYPGFDKIYFDDYTGVTFPTEVNLVLYKGGTGVTIENTTFIVRSLKISIAPKESELTIPCCSVLEPSEEEINRLGDGYTYIVQSYLKNTTTDTYARDWYKNNRVGVFNNPIDDETDYDNLTIDEIVGNAAYWSHKLDTVNSYENLECEFVYDEDYPLYILLTGDYPDAQGYGFNMGTVTYTEPVIVEKNVYNGPEPNGNYPVPILNLLSDTDSSTITLAANETGTPVRIYDFPLDDDYGTNESLAIRGIEVNGTLEFTDNLILYAKLINPNGEIGQRSIVLNVNDTESFTIGGLGDLWGFTTLQMTNLHNWQIELSASNILATGDSYLNINQVQVAFYVETVDRQEITIKVDGEDIAYYGAFIEAVGIPEGLETDTSFITVDGTDMNDAYRQNIKEKTITVEFNISECDLKTSTDLLRQITKLFVNEKDQYNRPIPNRIEFSHYPEDYFEYIMEKPFDISTEITGYNVKATLTIPAGTSYSQKDTVTNTVGNANGLAALRPIITIQPSSPNIEIKEGLSQQSFNMSYGGDWNDKIVEIDCDDRVVLLKKNAADEGVDISKYVDHNSDWFRLSGEFNFEAVNCVIRTVTFNERW